MDPETEEHQAEDERWFRDQGGASRDEVAEDWDEFHRARELGEEDPDEGKDG